MKNILRFVLFLAFAVIGLMLFTTFIQIVIFLALIAVLLMALRKVPFLGKYVDRWIFGVKREEEADSSGYYSPPRSTYVDDFRSEFLSQNPGQIKDITAQSEEVSEEDKGEPKK